MTDVIMQPDTAIIRSGDDPVPVVSAVAVPLPTIRRKPLGKAFWVAVTWLGIVTFCAIFGRFLPFVKKGTEIQDFITGILVTDGKWTKTFSHNHLLGVDSSGNDWFSLLILSARNSIIIAAATILIGFAIGGVLGMLAGYRRGIIDSAFSFVITVLLSMPPLLFIIMLVSVLSAGGDSSGIEQGLQTTVWKLSLSLGILSVPIIFRVVRGSTILFSSREFVVAARTLGAKTPRVLMREILPNVAKPMLAYGLVAAGNVMVIEGVLSFLGVGVGDAWAWGKMIQSGASLRELRISPGIVLFPAFTLFLTVLSFNFVGDKIRERLEVKEGNI
jgi:peptide/nickel transport system permease protein